MVEPIKKPGRKNPLQRSALPTLPPAARSREAHGLTRAAAMGEFALQFCEGCKAFLYPVREACPHCLSDDLTFREAPRSAKLLSETTIEVSNDPYFRERSPWRIGLAALSCGPQVLSHLHDDCGGPGTDLQLTLQLDKAGQAVFFAHPATAGPNWTDESKWREMTADPKFRRVLITDGRNEVGAALVPALQAAGCGQIFVGISEPWKPDNAALARLRDIGELTFVELDVTSEKSVRDLAGSIGAKVDILINTSDHLRHSALFDPGEFNRGRDTMERTVMGMLRLAQAFGPVMTSRGADGTNSAAAWVNVLSVYGEANLPEFGMHSVANAASISLSHWLRGEMRRGGVRVVNTFSGPLETEWYQSLPPPKVLPGAVAEAIVKGLKAGLEDIYVGVIAEDIRARLASNAKAVERELGQ